MRPAAICVRGLPSQPVLAYAAAMGDPQQSRWSLWSTGSVLSIGSHNSVLSVGSVGSALSIGSVGSVGSVLSIGSAGSIGSAFSAASAGSVMAYRAVRTTGDKPVGTGGRPTEIVAGVAVAAAVLDRLLRARR